MPPKKKKSGTSSSSSAPIKKFVSPKASYRFHEFICRRKAVKEGGFNVTDDREPVFKDVVHHKWTKFCSRPKEGYLGMVQEFYANFPDKINDVVIVRGKEVPVGKKIINNYFGLETYENGDEYTEFANSNPNLDIIANEICTSKPNWKRNSNGEPMHFRIGVVKPHCKMWFKFVICRLLPKQQVSDVTKDRAILIYSIVKGKTIDVGDLIFKGMNETAHNDKVGLLFPSLITALCLKAGVRKDDNESVINPRLNITLDSLTEPHGDEPRLRAFPVDRRMNDFMLQIQKQQQETHKYVQDVSKHLFLMVEALARKTSASFPDYPDHINPHLSHRTTTPSANEAEDVTDQHNIQKIDEPNSLAPNVLLSGDGLKENGEDESDACHAVSEKPSYVSLRFVYTRKKAKEYKGSMFNHETNEEGKSSDQDSISRKRKREGCFNTLNWIRRIARDPSSCDPLPQSQRQYYEKLILLVREEAMLLKMNNAIWQKKKQQMHPSMYDDQCGSKRLISSQRLVGEQLSSDKSLSDVYRSDDNSKRIHTGLLFQADLPEFLGSNYEGDSKWFGTRIWPLDKVEKNKTSLLKIGKGKRNSCRCQFPGSRECVRFHIKEKRIKLKLELGSAFYNWKFHGMGEEVALSWTKEEEKKFKKIVKSNRLSSEKYFWEELFKFFTRKGREALVSYYLNVFLLRRRGKQNRDSTLDIDSCDEGSEYGPVSNRFGKVSIGTIFRSSRLNAADRA